MKVTILQGLPGSGKSTYAQNLINSIAAANDGDWEGYVVVSADHFFMRVGTYSFNPGKLPEAHAECLREYVDALRHEAEHVFVDNTNTSVAEVAPYYALAQAYGAEVEILYFPCDPQVAAERNTHGVPLAGCQAMAKRLEEFEKQMPPWWKRRVALT
jgi:predicted kinase